ncbi:MAG: hypothetical protein OXB95_05050 [Rhodobacteraceae bacterium]|nr:hypothetical protein [Paracoccaceae bacterium]
MSVSSAMLPFCRQALLAAVLLALCGCAEQAAAPPAAQAAADDPPPSPAQAEPAPDPVATVEQQYEAEAEATAEVANLEEAETATEQEGNDTVEDSESEQVLQMRRFEPLDHFDPNRESSVIEYALGTDHAVGTAIHERPAALSTSAHGVQTRCSVHEDAVVAQHEFLENGGPELDVNRIDPDGDGFVCGWDPEPYRRWLK